MRASITRAFFTLALISAPAAAQNANPAGTTSGKDLRPQQWREDLAHLMKEVKARHRNVYHTTSPATLDSAAADLDARIPQLSRHEIIAGMMRLLAMVGDGHTNIYPTRDSIIAFRSLPVSLYAFKDGWHVRSARTTHRSLVGAKVVSIGGVPIAEAFERIKPYVGRDNTMGALYWAPYLLAMPEMLHAVKLAASPDSARFELEAAGARRIVWLKPHERVQMTPSDTDLSWWARTGWVDARDRAPKPLWLSHRPDTTMWWFTLVPGTRTGYAQISQVRNSSAQTFKDFTDKLLHFSDTARIDKLIIDLRLNRGGNGTLLNPLTRGILKRPHINQRGKLLVLTGRSTWSAAQFFVNDLAEFSEATFVGEPTASRGNHYGDSRQIKLPNSGITARASIYYWQDWHPLDTRQWVAVEVAAEPTFEDYAAGRDVALTAALSHVPAPSPVNRP